MAARAQALGLPLQRKLTLELPQSLDPFACLEGGFELTRRLVRGGERFTAVIAFDDLTALGCIRALHQEGRSVPEEVSVVGFDDISIAGLMIPALTTVRQPMQKLGEMAAARALETIARGRAGKATSKGRLRLLRPQLVVRESTGNSTKSAHKAVDFPPARR